MNNTNTWNQLDALKSRGGQMGKAGSMGALHAHRERTLSQFFTPEWITEFAWKTLLPAFKKNQAYSLLDNSIGAGSLFRFATPEQFSLSGLDIDGELMGDVSRILDESGFDIDIRHAGMEQVILSRYSAALINPPFSIPLSSPTLQPYPGVTHYGKHGPDTSALSHEYALAQALAHSDMVAAIVPSTTTEKLKEFGDAWKRLRAIYTLPSDAFRDEDVQSAKTDLLIFGRQTVGAAKNAPDVVRIKRRSIDRSSLPEDMFQFVCRSTNDINTKAIRVVGIETSKPVIDLPSTDDKRVILTRAGRDIKLTFFDGATEGKVKNALFRKCLHSTRKHRLPKKTKYSGQYQLNLDVLALQDAPFSALDQVARVISGAGGLPFITPDLRNGLKAVVKQHAKMTVPYGRTVFRKGTPKFKATARTTGLLNRHQKGAAVAMGEEVTALRSSAGFLVDCSKGLFDCEHDKFFSTFDVEDHVLAESYWEEIAPPIKASYPQQITALENRARTLGLDKWLSWDYQLTDLAELAFRGSGICAWQMALGKARLAVSLSMLLNGASFLVVKSRLIDEMERELKDLGIDPGMFQVISSLADTQELKKINIISYEKLKSPIHAAYPKLTFAKRLKGRVDNIICDEGGLLTNPLSQQSGSVWQLGARRRYIFDGTPTDYPRDFLPLASWSMGEERSYQPYSLSRGHIEQCLFLTASKQQTGRNAFHDHYIQFEWATNEFLDTGKGAKREVPKIKSQNLEMFRQWLGPIVKRRVQQEPAVTKHVKFPVPTLHPPRIIDWGNDIKHLGLYVQVVEEFANWYRDYVKTQELNEKGLNLTMILARLEACFKAANVPSTVKGFGQPFNKLTSKEIACIDLIEEEVSKGRRPIVFARNPVVLKRLARELDKLGISNLVFTGEETIKKRTQRLNEKIREGDAQVMLASLGVTQDGLNLHQLNTFIFYNRSWRYRQTFQSIYRLIRPLQKDEVYGYFLDLEGSIDCYMAQLGDWKAVANDTALDFGEQTTDDEEFVHFDAFIQRFLEGLPVLKEQLENHRNRHAA